MAYVSQEMKAKMAPTLKAICKKYGIKASIAVRHHSTLVLNIKSGPIDFISNFNKIGQDKPRGVQFQPAKDSLDINPHWYSEHFDGKALKFLSEIVPAMYGPDYFDHSDSMTDYFHVSHYVDINVGQWNKPYVCEK